MYLKEIINRFIKTMKKNSVQPVDENIYNDSSERSVRFVLSNNSEMNQKQKLSDKREDSINSISTKSESFNSVTSDETSSTKRYSIVEKPLNRHLYDIMEDEDYEEYKQQYQKLYLSHMSPSQNVVYVSDNYTYYVY